VGAEYAYDENGGRVVGGYVGDFGEPPELVVHHWDEDVRAWVIPEDEDEEGEPEVSDNADYLDNVMPLALWQTSFVVQGVGSYTMEDVDQWQGPYVALPRDDTPDDDDLHDYTDGPASGSDEEAENRRFFLRQGRDRLVDGWGSSLLVYRHEDDLVFVSAGTDRRINYDDDASDYAYGAPADTTLSGNGDNLVLVLTREQWDLTDQKTMETRRRLKDLMGAILGRTTSYAPADGQPTGYAVDMGGLETLTGSYVTNGGNVYHCLRRHASSSHEPTGLGNTYWERVGTDADDYPYAPAWSADHGVYHGPQWQLLLMNADYVRHDADGDGNDEYYRCTGSEVSGSFDTDDWAEDDAFSGCAWVQEFESTMEYNDTDGGVLPTWRYYDSVGFGAGWRGPYATRSTTPGTDAWGNPVRMELHREDNDPENDVRDDGSITLVSDGPDEEADTDDDLGLTLYLSDCTGSAEVSVSALAAVGGTSAAVSCATTDYVSAYCPYNGAVGRYDALVDSTMANEEEGGLFDGVFFFKENRGTVSGSFAYDAQPEITDGLGGMSVAGNGPRLPVGPATIVYRSEAYSNEGTLTHASPNPGKGSVAEGDDPGPAGYQDTVIITPRTSGDQPFGLGG
jgi:hypothetical protein